jgi:hypothetical protein
MNAFGNVFGARPPAQAQPPIPDPVNGALTRLTTSVSGRIAGETALLAAITARLREIAQAIVQLPPDASAAHLQAIAATVQAQAARLENMDLLNADTASVNRHVDPINSITGSLRRVGGWTPRPTKRRRKKRQTRRSTF